MKTFREAGKLLKAALGQLRAVSVHRDALVLTSLMWQTNAVAVRAGGEAMLIDSPYFPEELDALPEVLAGAGFEPDALIATHGDFDHLLGRLAFPGLALGLGEPSVERLHREPGAAQRDLRDHDAQFYVRAQRAAGARAGADAAGARLGRAGRPGDRAAPRRGPHRRRHGAVRALVRRSCAPATTCRAWRSR